MCYHHPFKATEISKKFEESIELVSLLAKMG